MRSVERCSIPKIIYQRDTIEYRDLDSSVAIIQGVLRINSRNLWLFENKYEWIVFGGFTLYTIYIFIELKKSMEKSSFGIEILMRLGAKTHYNGCWDA